jgi:hypothetical protein
MKVIQLQRSPTRQQTWMAIRIYSSHREQPVRGYYNGHSRVFTDKKQLSSDIRELVARNSRSYAYLEPEKECRISITFHSSLKRG